MGADSEGVVIDAPRERFVVVRDVNLLPGLWPLIETMLGPACEHSQGEITLERLAEGLCAGVYGLVVILAGDAPKALGVLEVREHAEGRVMWIVLAGGEQSVEWPTHDDALKGVARELGCSVIRVRGRRGWMRKLPHWRMVLELDV